MKGEDRYGNAGMLHGGGKGFDCYDMDKLWDGLHFLLTGSSATEPVRDNLLSEAIVGSKVFCEEEDADYIAYIYPQQLKAIQNAMEAVDIHNLLVGFSPKAFAEKGIYPTIWMREDKEVLREDLKNAYLELKEFYQKMVADEMGVIVSIY